MTEDERNKWLAGLKPGDTVAVIVESGAISGTRVYVTKIESRPRGTFKLVSGGEFNRRGTHRTDSWHSSEIAPVTDEIRVQVKYDRLVSRLRRVDWESEPLSILERIAAILDEEPQP